MSVPLLDPISGKMTGEKLGELDAAKWIACLQRRVDDLEGEAKRRGIDLDEGERRADQNAICNDCGKTFGQHPYGGPIGFERSLFLHRLCNGDLVKL